MKPTTGQAPMMKKGVDRTRLRQQNPIMKRLMARGVIER